VSNSCGIYEDIKRFLTGNVQKLKFFHNINRWPLLLTTGLPDFSWTMIPKPEKSIPDEHKMHQMVIKFPKCLYVKYSNGQKVYQNFHNIRASKIYPNWNFWSENKPSGNPD
jgi:hypothetical protein